LATKAYEFERLAVQQISGARQRIGAELSKVIIGQQDVIDHLLIAVLSGGFHVFATQNPIEMEGTYPLPEAQLDRFMFNVWIDYLPEDDEVAVVRQTTTTEPEPIEQIFTGEDLLRFHDVVRKVPIAEDVVRYAVRIATASRPGPHNSLDFINEWVTWGAGLRASQYMVLGAKARALLYGRSHVSFDDIRALALPVLRHRVLINYRAEAEGVVIGNLVDRLLKSVKETHKK